MQLLDTHHVEDSKMGEAMSGNGLRAVVVGRSIAGLAAAAALSRHFN